MSDTPLTDAAIREVDGCNFPKVSDSMIGLARSLERALTAAKAEARREAIEECAKTAAEMDCAMLCGVGHEVAARIRALSASKEGK